MLKPLHDSILFVFLDEASRNGFTNKTEAGIIYKSLDDSAQSARWAKVLAVGPKVKIVKPGMTILIDALRWTEGIIYDGVKIWRTVEKDVSAIQEED